MQPIDAFSRLKKDGEFTEKVDGAEFIWYWYTIGGGYRCMARRTTDPLNAPTIYREFFVNDNSSLIPKRYF